MGRALDFERQAIAGRGARTLLDEERLGGLTVGNFAAA